MTGSQPLHRQASVIEGFDPNAATNEESEAIKLARSMDRLALQRVMGEVMMTWTPSQLRRHGAATFVLARRKENGS